jgi:hypothetical protein
VRHPGVALFPSASVLLSRAWWFGCAHPKAVLGLGLLGSAPTAALLLLYLREAHETLLLGGEPTTQGLKPLAFGLAAVFFTRYPFRMALARWMAGAMEGAPVSLPAALGFGLAHTPAALLYASLSILGWVLGAVVLTPYRWVFQSSLAFHRFAAGRQTPWAAFVEGGRLPLGRLGARLSGAATTLYAVLFFLLWTTPRQALGLAEWLFRLDVAALRPVFALGSGPWLSVALVIPLVAVELLWAIAFGLLASEWQKLSGGSDLQAALVDIERRGADVEAFAS